MALRGGAIELIPGKLYYVALRSSPTESSKQAAHFWSVGEKDALEPADEFSYWNFFLDWGPLSLGNLFRFCRTMNFKLKSEILLGKAIYVYSGAHAHKRTNAAFLLSAWLLLYGGRTPEEAFAPFQDVFPPFPPFHDASPCACTFDLTIPHCLRGLEKACRFGFFDFNTFDVEEYEHYEQVENGDLNWLVDRKFLAFAGPHGRSEITREGYRTLTPRNYIPYFKKHNVSLVVRLNKKYYDEKMFLDAGIDHVEAYFLDGSVPPPNVLRQFIAACETTPGAVAVHCKAGLGRTGTCIGCYIMKHYRFTAAEVIGWMRISRPGSVIGPQQYYLERMEGPMHREGIAFRQRAGILASPMFGHGDISPRREVEGDPRFGKAAGGEAAVAGKRNTAAANVRGNVARAAAVGSRSSRSPRPFGSSIDVFERGDNKGVPIKEKEPSPRRSKPNPDQGFRRADNNSSVITSGRRRATGSERPPPQQQHQQQQASPLSRLERGGDGVESMSQNLSQLEIERGENATTGKGGPGGGRACGTTAASMQPRTRQATNNTSYRQGSVPVGLSARRSVPGRSTAACPAGKRLVNGTASAAAAAGEAAPGSRTPFDVWGDVSAAGEGGKGEGGGGSGGRGRTQGDLLLQQRARGPSRR